MIRKRNIMEESGVIKVGIIGTGGIANGHANGLLQEAGLFKIESACDSNPERLAVFGKKFQISSLHTDYRWVIEDPKIRAVIVCLPHNLHEKVCCEALLADKHVLVEKPIARTIEEADRIIQAAVKSNRTLMVAHNQRFHPVYQHIHEILKRNTLGKIFSARIDHHQNFNPPKGSWWRSKEAVGGGCVIGSGVHRLDILRWYLGEVKEVFAYQSEDPGRLEAEVLSAAVLKFASGAIAEFFCNWGVYRSPVCEGLSLFGMKGDLYIKNSENIWLVNHGQDPADQLIEERVAPSGESMYAHFAKSILSRKEPLTSGTEGRKSLEVVTAIYRSAESGLPIKLPLTAGK